MGMRRWRKRRSRAGAKPVSRNLRVYRLVATALKRAGGDKEKLREWVGFLVDTTLGANCFYCGVLLALANISLDHKVPVSRGGANTQENLQAICRRCNQAKGSFTDKEFDAIVRSVE